MEDQIRRIEKRAERAAGALEALADEPDVARIALVGALCSAAVCWFAIAWGEPLLLIALPLVVGAAVAVARHQRRKESGDTGEPEFEPAPAEVDAWLARLPTTPGPTQFAAPEKAVLAPLAEPAPLPPLPTLEAAASEVRPASEASSASEAVFEVQELRAGAPVVLETRDSFDAAVDAAFELIEERDPPALEIVAAKDTERDVVWSYTREAAQASKPSGTLELFGFDATRWSQQRR